MDNDTLMKLNQMSQDLEGLKFHFVELQRQIDQLASKLNAHFPQTFSCPHCGRKVAEHAKRCTYCEKGFVGPVVG